MGKKDDKAKDSQSESERRAAEEEDSTRRAAAAEVATGESAASDEDTADSKDKESDEENATAGRRAADAGEADGEEAQTENDEKEDSKKDSEEASEKEGETTARRAKKSHKRRILHPKRHSRVLSASLWAKIRKLVDGNTTRPLKFDVKKDLKASLVANLEKPKGIDDAKVSKEAVEKVNADERVKSLLPTMLSAGTLVLNVLVGTFLMFFFN